MAINIKINERTSGQLTALKDKRAEDYKRTGDFSIIKNKQDITAEAIEALFKKEIKKWIK